MSFNSDLNPLLKLLGIPDSRVVRNAPSGLLAADTDSFFVPGDINRMIQDPMERAFAISHENQHVLNKDASGQIALDEQRMANPERLADGVFDVFNQKLQERRADKGAFENLMTSGLKPDASSLQFGGDQGFSNMSPFDSHFTPPSRRSDLVNDPRLQGVSSFLNLGYGAGGDFRGDVPQSPDRGFSEGMGRSFGGGFGSFGGFGSEGGMSLYSGGGGRGFSEGGGRASGGGFSGDGGR